MTNRDASPPAPPATRRAGVALRSSGAAAKGVLVAAALVALALVLGGAVLWAARRPLEQPIAFNHALHVGQLEMDCTDCHLYAVNGVRATIPNIEVCADCHDEAASESAEETRLVEYVASGERVPWRKIYRVPEHVYFSHRRHTQLGGIECETCHGAVGEQVEPVGRPLVRLSMEHCMRCHQDSGVSNDCLLCHR